jgi:hypothetical protein
MAVTVNFRVVGVYCLLENLSFPHLSPQSTVEQVMNEIQAHNPAFRFHGGQSNPLVDSIEYTFGPTSTIPPNSTHAGPGLRHLENDLGMSSARVLQYYRSVKGLIDGVEVELVVPTKGQPSYTTTSLDTGFTPPPSFQPLAYNLTWRLVQIQMNDHSRAKFITAKLEALSRRRQK